MAKKIRATFTLDAEVIEKLEKIVRTTKTNKSAFINDLLIDAIGSFEVLFDAGIDRTLSQAMRLIADKFADFEDFKKGLEHDKQKTE